MSETAEKQPDETTEGMSPEQRATKSVDYLLRVDALASHDYRPEIEAEITRAIREALAAPATAAERDRLLAANAALVRALGVLLDEVEEGARTSFATSDETFETDWEEEDPTGYQVWNEVAATLKAHGPAPQDGSET